MDQIGPDQTRWDQIGPDRTRSNQIGPDRTGSDQIKPDRTRSDQIQIGSDDLGALRSTQDTFTVFSVQV
jgi:hypothetical protein